MDIIAFNEAATANERIEKIVANPDSVAGLVSVPNLVPTGETITIPVGRTVVHPNLKVEGTLAIDGTLFIPSGGTYTADELDVTVVKQNGSVVATETYVVSAIDAIPDVIDATETVKGIVELATIAEVQAGTDTVRAVTPDGFRSASFGVGQTWQDVTASRVAGTTYTNSTGKPIMVHVTTQSNSSSNSTSINLNGVSKSLGDTSAVALHITASVVIPHGHTYSIVLTGSATIKSWLELR